MPNLFPEGGNDPMYNTVDAALLFINCVWLYSEASGNTDFVEEMYPDVYKRQVRFPRKNTGTRHSRSLCIQRVTSPC